MKTIVLMGPIGAGKSTQAKLLSKKLGIPRCCYDDVKADYLKQVGFSKQAALLIGEKHGEYAMVSHMNIYKSQILGPILADHPGHIIDLGGGAQCFNEEQQIERAKQAFDPIADVILLQPSKDLATNINSLPGFKEGFPINTYIIMHPTNTLFAKKFVYTLGKTPNETMREIISLMSED